MSISYNDKKHFGKEENRWVDSAIDNQCEPNKGFRQEYPEGNISCFYLMSKILMIFATESQ